MSKLLALLSLIPLALAVPTPRQTGGKGLLPLSSFPTHPYPFLTRGHHTTLPVELGLYC